MKHYLYITGLFITAVIMSSCTTVYHYIQVIDTKPTEQSAPMTQTEKGMLYEDSHCAIIYHLWAKGGNGGFEFYNKTDEIIYLDLSSSFFIRNGIAFDYNEHSIKTPHSAVMMQYYSGNISAGNESIEPLQTTQQSMPANQPQNTNSKAEEKEIVYTGSVVLAIPPHASKVIDGYHILQDILMCCERELYPRESAASTYSTENSPLVFSNYITYRVGPNGDQQSVLNEFYATKVTNYVRHTILQYTERNEGCINMTPTRQQTLGNTPKLYDAFVIVPTVASFYLPYRAISTKILYRQPTPVYYWSEIYQGYTKQP